MVKAVTETMVEVELSLIDEPKVMARLEIDPVYISELAQSIKEVGLLQPILLRSDGERFEIVAGHCRFLAHRKLELPRIKAFVRKMSDQQMALARATENLARVDLSAVEEAQTYSDLVRKHGMSIEQIAQKFGKSPGTIKRRMDVLKMPPMLQEAVHKGQLSMSAAEELWPISDPVDLEYYLMFAIENGCTKEVARGFCKQWKDSQRHAQEPGAQGGGAPSVYQPRPVYIPCDLCEGPSTLEEIHRLSVCPECFATIKKNM